MILAEAQGDKNLLYSQYSELFNDWDVIVLYPMFRERKLKTVLSEKLQEVLTTTFLFSLGDLLISTRGYTQILMMMIVNCYICSFL